MEDKEIVEGVILDIDYGFGMKYNDTENLYLKLEIQQFDGVQSTQLFRQNKIGKLLLQFKGDYKGELSIKHLKHQRVFLLKSETTNGIPNAIAKLPPEQYPQYSWIENDDWN